MITVDNVIDLKEAVRDYKPQGCSDFLRYHALEVFVYLENLETLPEPQENNIVLKDLAVLTNN